jgi:hypothetical protein
MTDADVVPLGESPVHRLPQDVDLRVLARDLFNRSVGGRVVHDRDGQPRVSGGREGGEAAAEKPPSIVVQQDDPDERIRCHSGVRLPRAWALPSP